VDGDGVIKVADIKVFCSGLAGAEGVGCNTTQLVQSLRLGPDGTSQTLFVQGLADGAYDLAGIPLSGASPATASTSGGGGGGGTAKASDATGGNGGASAGQSGVGASAGSVDPCASVLCSEDCEDSCGW